MPATQQRTYPTDLRENRIELLDVRATTITNEIINSQVSFKGLFNECMCFANHPLGISLETTRRTKDSAAAFDEIAERAVALREQHGSESMAVYLGNPTVHNYGTLLFNRSLSYRIVSVCQVAR